MKGLAHLTIAIATVAACSCADAGTAPPPALTGTLTLASYNGAALPAYIYPSLGACSSMIVAGSLTTAADGHVVFTRSYTVPCKTGSSAATETRTGVLSVDGTAITIALDGDALSPPQVFRGTLNGGQLTLQYSATDPAAPSQQTYLLVRP
jgi:hypothetical protein